MRLSHDMHGGYGGFACEIASDNVIEVTYSDSSLGAARITGCRRRIPFIYSSFIPQLPI